MPILLDNAIDVALARIVYNAQHVTEIRILTPLEGVDAVAIQPTLAFIDREKHTVTASAPLAPLRFEGVALKALMSDAYARAKAYEKLEVSPDQCLYAGIRDAVYAQLTVNQGWSPK